MANNIISNVIMKHLISRGYKSLKKLEKQAKDAKRTNNALLLKILRENKNSEFGREHHFGEIHTLAEFRKNVPLTTYHDYEPALERMVKGENNVLTSKRIIGFAKSSASSGTSKYLPATQGSIDVYTDYTFTRALALSDEWHLREYGTHIKPGRGFYTEPAFDEFLPNGLPCSTVVEVAAIQVGKLFPFILSIPEDKMTSMKDGDWEYLIWRYALEDDRISFAFGVFFSHLNSRIGYMKENWKMLVEDIKTGKVNPKVNLVPELRKKLEQTLKANPKRAEELKKELEKGFNDHTFRKIWPRLSVVCAIGNASFAPFAKKVKSTIADVPFDYSVYGASEGLFACCYELENTDMQLVLDSCFFEFIPIDGTEEDICTLSHLEVGKEYEIVITNQAGFYRYRINDVVKVVGYRDTCPLVQFAYRKGQLVNMAGEKFTEEHAIATIERLEQMSGEKIHEWILYRDESVLPNGYEFILECDEGVDLSGYAEELEPVMTEINYRYGAFREKKEIGDLVIKMQKPGTHEAWRKSRIEKGALPGNIKPVHIIDNEEKKNFFLDKIEIIDQPEQMDETGEEI